jgi:hypothetical protein
MGEEYMQGNSGSSRGKTAELQDLNESLLKEDLMRQWNQRPEPMRCMWTRNYKCWAFDIAQSELDTMIQNAMAVDFIASAEGAKIPLVL